MELKKIKVVLRGTGEGLLMHSTKAMEEENIKSRAPKHTIVKKRLRKLHIEMIKGICLSPQDV